MPSDYERPLVSAVAEFAEAADRLAKLARQEFEGERPEPLVGYLSLLIDLRDAMAFARDARADLGEIAYDLMSSSELPVAGFGTFRKQHGWDRRWDDGALVAWLARQAREERYVDEETGEVEPVEQAMGRLLLHVAKLSYARVTALAEHGLSRDEIEDLVESKTPIRHSVSLPRQVPRG